MPESVDLKFLIALPPEKAINYLKNKGYEFSWNWEELWQESHTKSFTVAKVMKKDILDDIKEIIDKSMAEGLTFQQFKQELEPKLKNKGWWGIVSGKPEDVRKELLKRKLIADKNLIPDGEEKIKIQLGSPWRLKTIYRTNIQTAYMAGRYQTQIDNIENRPYFEYVAVMDRRTRPAHAQLNGRIFKHDDEFWNSFYPPNGWGCRCRIRALSEENIKDRKFGIDSSEGHLSKEMKLVSTKTGELRPVTVYTDPTTGHKIAPDVDWSYNPGKEFHAA